MAVRPYHAGRHYHPNTYWLHHLQLHDLNNV